MTPRGPQGVLCGGGRKPPPCTCHSTLFFDKCLGWGSLCVEPQAQFHKALKEQRSCTLVPECISTTKEVLNMVETPSAATAHVAPAGSSPGNTVNCGTPNHLLARYAGSARKQVDVLILDVGGYEMRILEATQFADVSVDAVMVEDLLMLPKPDVLDMLMSQQG